MVKTITISNNTTRRITYVVSLEGSSDFIIREKNISLDSNQKKEFVVKFVSRITATVQARIIFKRDRESLSQGTPLVFDLVSNIQGRRSTDSVEIEDVPLYEMKHQEIKVFNPFEKDAVFQVSVES